MADVGKITVRVQRTFNENQVSWSGTGAFAGLNLSQTGGSTRLSPLVSAPEADLYWAAILDAVSAILKV